jgi:5-methylcytosine-specific restriction protein B
VPPNLRILGTMNTADRSIKLLDAAIRRRFAFIELLPDVTPLRGAVVGGLELDTFLQELNRRIVRTEGREKQIGQSYLLDNGSPVADPELFAARFRREILPLLQEYAYDDYRELGEYLGKALVDAELQRLVPEAIDQPAALIAALVEEYQTEAADEA